MKERVDEGRGTHLNVLMSESNARNSVVAVGSCRSIASLSRRNVLTFRSSKADLIKSENELLFDPIPYKRRQLSANSLTSEDGYRENEEGGGDVRSLRVLRKQSNRVDRLLPKRIDSLPQTGHLGKRNRDRRRELVDYAWPGRTRTDVGVHRRAVQVQPETKTPNDLRQMKETRRKRKRRRGTNINHQRFDLSIASISSFGGAINVAFKLPPALVLPFLTCRLSGTASLGFEESVVEFVSEVMLN